MPRQIRSLHCACQWSIECWTSLIVAKECVVQKLTMIFEAGVKGWRQTTSIIPLLTQTRGGGLKCSWLTPNSLNVIKAMTTDLLTISFAKPTSVFFNRQTQTIG